MNRKQVQAGKAIQQETGRTFHLATRFLPKRIRHATYVLYGFFRIADEVVDSERSRRYLPQAQRLRLEQLRAEALGEGDPENPVLIAFQELKEEYGIPDAEVDAFIDAMAADIHKDEYATYEELETYMRGSAAAVGVMMLHVMDPEEKEAARPHAVALGEAFQMTNFLRDVREDVLDRDRIYLPISTLNEHGVTAEQVRALEFDQGFARAMEAELRRTEQLYKKGVAGIKYLPEDTQFPVLLAAVLYADHHRLIRNRGYDVLSDRPSLGGLRKLSLAARTRWNWVWSKDPEMVFRAVSALPSDEHQSTDTGPESALPIR